MQYLKDEIKDAIIKAALTEFMEKSYQDASMRVIAKSAGITVGNIYRYFTNKDALFNDIMQPVWQNVTRAIFDNYNQTFDLFPITEIITAIMEIYKRYDRELYILLFKSKGSQFDNVRNELVLLIEERIQTEMLPVLAQENRDVEDDFIFHILANCIVEGLYLIIRECGNDFPRVEKLIEKMMTTLVKDLYQRL
jgi:AcrR family transcriptional regulator